MLYAIIESGGKQFKAVEGQYLEIDRLAVEVGDKVGFDKVLLLANEGATQVGTPYLDNVKVNATALSHFRGKKIIIFKYKPSQRYRVKTGHRQNYTRLVVDAIVFPGKKETAEAPAKVTEKQPSSRKKKAASIAKKKTTSAKPSAVTKTAKSATTKKHATTTKPAAVKKTTEAKKTSAQSKSKPAAKPTTAKKKTAAKSTKSADTGKKEK